MPTSAFHAIGDSAGAEGSLARPWITPVTNALAATRASTAERSSAVVHPQRLPAAVRRPAAVDDQGVAEYMTASRSVPVLQGRRSRSRAQRARLRVG
jgi:hypothetical protein